MNTYNTHTHALARGCEETGREQPLADHLTQVAALAEQFSSKAGLPSCGRLVGLGHDYGKYSLEFYDYIRSACGLIKKGEARYVDAQKLKGTVDHSTAGAQLIWRELCHGDERVQAHAQLLALVAASHHSGLIDSVAPDGTDCFKKRITKPDEKTHFSQCQERCDARIAAELEQLLGKPTVQELHQQILAIHKRVLAYLPPTANAEEISERYNCTQVEQGLLARFLLSCLLDADRINSAEFEHPDYRAMRANLPRQPWARLIQRLEAKLASFTQKKDIDGIRHSIAEACLHKSKQPKGLFSLTVPTGGGKTLASLRFALHHAQEWGMDRVIYVIPYTSIIDQNAQVAREILEADEKPGSIVLEHHSSFFAKKDKNGNDTPVDDEDDKAEWQRTLLAENWEAPVVFTTMVQFLESLFGSGTRSARRMHNLANSLIIFDEIQTLPIKCLYLFCNALNFLNGTCGSSAVLCTATQPTLDALPRPTRGSLAVSPPQIIDDVSDLFIKLQRVDFFLHTENEQTPEEVAALAMEELRSTGSCLVVCNTKKWAEEVYAACRTQLQENVFYLSTNLCPAHRMDTLEVMRGKLDAKKREPVLCISTQLIECGVDISFGAVIRCAAGLDSILQAAGRCNRHGGKAKGRVHVVRAKGENLGMLKDIETGKNIFLGHIVHGFAARLRATNNDLTAPEIIAAYFGQYYLEKRHYMAYALSKSVTGKEETLLNLLGTNTYRPQQQLVWPQAFATANHHFQVLDAPTTPVLVPYTQEGADLIAELASTAIFTRKKELLQKAQRYSVNLYANTIKKLDSGLWTLQESGILTLREQYYDKTLGVVATPTASLGLMNY